MGTGRGGAAFNCWPEQVRSPRGLPEVRKHARAHCEQASKQAASGSTRGSVARVVRGSRRSQLDDAAQVIVGERAAGGESGQCWRPRPRAPLPEGGRPMGSSASSIENGAGGQGRPSTPGPEEITLGGCESATPSSSRRPPCTWRARLASRGCPSASGAAAPCTSPPCGGSG